MLRLAKRAFAHDTTGAVALTQSWLAFEVITDGSCLSRAVCWRVPQARTGTYNLRIGCTCTGVGVAMTRVQSAGTRALVHLKVRFGENSPPTASLPAPSGLHRLGLSKTQVSTPRALAIFSTLSIVTFRAWRSMSPM